MWDWTKLVNLQNIWEERWKGNSRFGRDLKIIFYDNALRITSGNYTQSKKITNDNLINGYWYYQANAVDFATEDPQILILGFGGGTIGTLLKQKYPQAHIDGVEIDPVMISLGKKYLDLHEKDFNIIINDARDFIRECPKQYDAIMVDLYLEDQTPVEIDSVPFYRQLKTLLKKGGVVTINRIYEKDTKTENGILGYNKFMKLFQSVFPAADVVEVPNQVSSKNYIFIGRN